MSSSSEAFSDISSYDNHKHVPIKVNVSKKVIKPPLGGLQPVRKEGDLVSNSTKTLGLKPQSNTTSKISHALEMLNKFNNKYKIKSNASPNVTKVIDSSKSPTSVSVTSKQTRIEQVGPSSQQSKPRSIQALRLGLEDVNLDPSDESTHSNGIIPQDKILKGVRESDILPEVIAVDKTQDYESDFESCDSESDDESSAKSQSSARPRSALTKPNLHSHETDSSIHTIADGESNYIENVGIFNNIRLLSFSDLDPKTVQKIDVPVHLNDSSALMARTKSGDRRTEKGIDESKNNFQRTLDIPIPSNLNVTEKVNTSSDKSSDYESIAESLVNSNESDDSSVPFRRNIFTMDDLDGVDSDQTRQAPLTIHEKENGDIRRGVTEAKTQGNDNVTVLSRKLSTLAEDIEEINDDDSVKQTEEQVLTEESSANDTSYESDFAESEVKPTKGSSEESSRVSRESRPKSGIVSPVECDSPVRKHTRSQTMKNTTSIDKWNLSHLTTLQNLKEMPSAKVKETRVKEIEREPKEGQLTTRDVGVQTEFSENGEDEFSEYLRERMRGRRIRSPLPVFEPLNLSWNFDEEANNRIPTFIFQHQTLTPEVTKAVTNKKPEEEALDFVLRQQISLTKHFMALQYKMYQTYSMSVKQLTNQYTPVTLEETKEFIRTHRKLRRNGNDQQVF